MIAQLLCNWTWCSDTYNCDTSDTLRSSSSRKELGGSPSMYFMERPLAQCLSPLGFSLLCASKKT